MSVVVTLPVPLKFLTAVLAVNGTSTTASSLKFLRLVVIFASLSTNALRSAPVFASVTLTSAFFNSMFLPVYSTSFVLRAAFTQPAVVKGAAVMLKDLEITPLYSLVSTGLAVTLTFPTFTKSPV